MYKSFPLTAAYFILVIYSALSIGYELYMSIACGEHDCLSTIYALNAARLNPDKVASFRIYYEGTVEIILRFWHIRQ